MGHARSMRVIAAKIIYASCYLSLDTVSHPAMFRLAATPLPRLPAGFNGDDEMKTISKTFDTSKQAERFMWRLYDKYDSVKLVKAPMFSEQGVYTFAVAA